MNDPAPLALAGEPLTCHAGHRLGVVSGDVPGTRAEWQTDDFDTLGGPIHGMAAGCPVCGQPTFLMLVSRSVFTGKAVRHRSRVCVGGEWRPPLDESDYEHFPQLRRN